MKWAYYNEIDPFAAAWLRELIKAGAIADGEVDERSITEVQRDDFKGFVQCHFFAGIGGWSLGLRLALWPDDRPVWTGSCPCGPYSIVGKRAAFEDARDLWPAWLAVMDGSEPVIFGEQVADAIELGWFDRTADDMAAFGKSCWPAVLPACAAGFAHEGERLFFVVEADTPRLEGHAWHGGSIDQGALAAGHAAATDICGFIDAPWDGLSRPVPFNNGEALDGLRNRVGKLRGYGNAIVPQVAAEFVRAYLS